MEKLKSIKIINFQSHEKTELEFDEGVNVITGPSDQGKSAIIRALRWVLYNEPRGTDFIRHNQTKCQVSITLNNGFEITRKRTPSKNRYILVTPKGEEHIYERVGSNVPEEILQVHGMRKINLDKDEETTLNMDYQLDGAFLLTDTGSTRARTIGRLINVHVVDSAIRETKRDINNSNIKEKQLKQDLKEDKEKLKKFDNLSKLEDEIRIKKMILKDIKNINQKLKKLKSFQEKLKRLNEKISKLDKVRSNLSQLVEAKDIYSTLLHKNKRLKELVGLLASYEDNSHRRKVGKAILAEVAATDKIEELYLRSKEKENLYSRLQKVASNYKRINKEIKVNQMRLDKTKGVEKTREIIDNKLPSLRDRIVELTNINKKLEQVSNLIKKKEIVLDLLPSDQESDLITRELVLICEKLENLKRLLVQKEQNIKSIQEGKVYISNLNNKIENLANEYSQILKKIGRCPTCFGKVEEHTVNKIITELKEV